MTTVNEAAGMPGPGHRPHVDSPLIIIVGADKGGVGKTTVTRALIDYVSRLGVPVRAFDTEPGSGVLRRFFPDFTKVVNAGSVTGQMEIIDGATPLAVTIIDARAGLLSPLLRDLARFRLMDDVKAGSIRLLVLHVVGTSVASAGEIPDIIAAMQGASLIRVNNHVDDESTFPPAVPGEVSIDVPRLQPDAYQAVDEADAGFIKFASEAASSRVLRGYVRSWLGDVHMAFDRAGIGRMVKP